MTKARDLANASTALSAVSATELGYVDGVTSAIQTQIDAKAPSSTAVTLTGTQTLTNKTLTSPALTTPTISTATTNGDILYGTGSGALTRLGIGTTDQVLKVTAGVPAWATASAGGMTLIATATPSAASTFSFASIPSTYKHLLVVVPELVWSTTNQHARMKFATGSYYSTRAMGTWGNAGTFMYATERGEASFGGGSDLTCPIQKGYTSSGTFGDISSATSIWINNYTATIDRLVTWQAAGNGGMFTATGIYDHNAAIDNITFTTQAGTVTGTAYLYGVS